MSDQVLPNHNVMQIVEEIHQLEKSYHALQNEVNHQISSLDKIKENIGELQEIISCQEMKINELIRYVWFICSHHIQP